MQRQVQRCLRFSRHWVYGGGSGELFCTFLRSFSDSVNQDVESRLWGDAALDGQQMLVVEALGELYLALVVCMRVNF